MSDNSNNRRKTLIVSVLAFLIAGGGIFLFFVIQGSNELTGKGKNKNFTFGSAAREGVSSFFKSVGVIPDEEGALTKATESRMEARGFLPDGEQATADVSNWMAKTPEASPSGSFSRPATPTSVPKMSAGAGSGLGGGGGGSKSSGGVSRFGEGSPQGTTSVSPKANTGAGGTPGKGAMGSLRNAKALLGEGLRSDSAMTASSKWNQSFGVGGPSAGGKGGDLAYNKSGLVNLDKIKSGEISSLKNKAAPEASPFERDKEAEKKDAGLQAAKAAAETKSKEDAEAKAKKEMASALTNAAGDALSKSGDSKSGPAAAGTDPGKMPITDEEKEEAKSLAFFKPESLGDGDSFKDEKVDIVRTPDGGAQYTIVGSMTVGGETVPYKDVVIRSPDGKLTFVDDKK